MKALIAAGLLLIAGAALAAPASADAKRPPRMQMDHAKHMAWDTAKDYKEKHEGEWGEAGGTFKCQRISRSVIDCKTTIEFWSADNGCVESPGAPGDPTGDGHCEAGTRWSEWWWGERHSWTMRYRARHWEDHYIADVYFPGDRYGDTNPKSKRFGGFGLKVTEIGS